MMSRIAILVNYRSAHGGLHDHVRDQVSFARDLGYDVTLACPPGVFATEMSLTADVVETDFADPEATARAVVDVAAPDLIHSHPGAAREAAFAVKALHAVPLLVTYHGSRPETLTAADPEVDIAICVSDLTRRYILRKTDVEPARVVVIPNAVDPAVFSTTTDRPAKPSVLFASRWDADKKFVLDVTIEAIEAISSEDRFAGVSVVVAGDGSGLPDLQEACSRAMTRVASAATFECRGWMSPIELAAAMAKSSVVVSPGRGALQGIAVGRPTVALGSKGYVGFLTGATLLKGLDANFGSGGIGPRQYPRGLIADDIQAGLACVDDVDLLAAYRIIADERTQSAVGQAHARVWAIAGSLRSREASPRPRSRRSSGLDRDSG